MDIELIRRKFDELGVIYVELNDEQKKDLEILKAELKEKFNTKLTDKLEIFFLNFGSIKIKKGETIVVKCIEENPISNERKTAEVNDFFDFIKDDSIIEALDDYDGRFKKGMIPVCESYHGDLICYHKSGALYYWFHEFDKSKAFTLISDNINEFVSNLEIKELEDVNLDEIEDDEDWGPNDKLKELLKKSGLSPRK